MKYYADYRGISGFGESKYISWSDLAEGLAMIRSPVSSKFASAIRADLESALESGEISGRTDLLEQVLRESYKCVDPVVW